MIEVEIRGPLQGDKAEKFKEYLDEEAQDKASYQEVAIFCQTDKHENFGPYVSAKARIQANYRRFADGQVQQRVVLKLSDPSGHGRQEYDMPLGGAGLLGFFELLKRFGVEQASFRSCQRHDYVIDGLEVALKFGHVCGDHYEVETSCAAESDIEAAKQKLLNFISPFELTVWEPAEYKQIIIRSTPLAPSIPFAEGVKKFDIK